LKKRGRPPKLKIIEKIETEPVNKTVKKRGRPPKIKVEKTETEVVEKPIKKPKLKILEPTRGMPDDGTSVDSRKFAEGRSPHANEKPIVAEELIPIVPVVPLESTQKGEFW